jgi:hypothetical protein
MFAIHVEMICRHLQVDEKRCGGIKKTKPPEQGPAQPVVFRVFGHSSSRLASLGESDLKDLAIMSRHQVRGHRTSSL